MEKLTKFKNASRTIWNDSLILGLFTLMNQIGLGYLENGFVNFFKGITPFIVLTCFLQAISGILVAIVIKYTDNILKAFATSISIVMSVILSLIMRDHQLNFQFMIGSLMVVLSVALYQIS